ncbi:MAG: signal peptidase II [Candidatus Doudnabacteria bacterium]|nr:signal peptidase II [Candidatus Doudnabacteria bacterium]
MNWWKKADWLWVAALLVIVDQLLKHTLSGELVVNPGVFLGLILPNALIILLHAIFLVVGVLWGLSNKTYLAKIVLALVVVSGSNFIDRVLFGGVIDYLQIWGVWFNLADVGVSVFLVLALFF